MIFFLFKKNKKTAEAGYVTMNILKSYKTQILLAADFSCRFSPLTDDDLLEHNESIKAEMISSNIARDDEGLVLPKKLRNPVLESSDRQNLHRELLFNQKM